MNHGTHRHDRHNGSRETGTSGDRRVGWAVGLNLLLTVVQIVGGLLAGSLSLVADAVHNLSDAVALGLAYIARKIARRPADPAMTFGYGRAEIVAALANYTVLIMIAAYLVYQAVWRLIEPQPVDGWIVVIVAGVALVVDTATMALTFRLSKESVNIRAAFLHNLSDALGSLGVIVAGTLIILFDWYVADALITLAIAAYIGWHVMSEIGPVIRILMLGTPPTLEPQSVLTELRAVSGIADVHHLHIWQLDERENALEAHVVTACQSASEIAEIKVAAKGALKRAFGINHTTLEFENSDENCPDAAIFGHSG
ncbi:MAG: cation diffusion facilitator family transporter [Alphaproteobacteria bacterium]